MKILIIGNMGYVGPGTVKQLRSSYPDAELIGFDIGYFANRLTRTPLLPEVKLNRQIIGDVRLFPAELLQGVNAVIYLAAISNDPMSTKYEDITLDVNYRSCIRIAELSRAAGVRSFVFASSCSIYGAASLYPKTEKDELNPLTPYAWSKVLAERELEPLATDGFTITCLRFGTACGISSRLRLDLVLNDFVASALISGEINILSDGTPWRPLINVLDMALAINWAINRSPAEGGSFLTVNTGSNRWNYQIKELALAVARVIPGCRVTINTNTEPDKRSYRVSFDLFSRLAPAHQPAYDLNTTVKELCEALTEMGLNDPKYRESKYMRLKMLSSLQEDNLLNENLSWTW